MIRILEEKLETFNGGVSCSDGIGYAAGAVVGAAIFTIFTGGAGAMVLLAAINGGAALAAQNCANQAG